MADPKEKFQDPSYHEMSKEVDEMVENEGLDKPQKVVPLDPEDSIPVVREPRLGDPDRAIREIEEDAERNPAPKTEPDFSPDVPEHEVPDEHDIPLEEAAKRLDEKEKEEQK